MFEFTSAYSGGPLYGGCGPKGISCYGNGGMLAVFEESVSSNNPQRLLRSLDNGVNWNEITPYYSPLNLWWYRLVSPAEDQLLVGTDRPQFSALSADDDGMARSLDGGDSWSGAFPSGYWIPATDDWDPWWIEPAANGRVWSFGEFSQGGTRINAFVSDDGGATWEPRAIQTDEYEPPTFHCGAYCGSGILFVGSPDPAYVSGADYEAGHPIWRSLDNGETWERTQLVGSRWEDESGYGTIDYIAYLGGATVAAAASSTTTGNDTRPLLWISHNLGDTWEDVASDAMDAAWGNPLSYHFPQWVAGWNHGQQIVLGIYRESVTDPAAIVTEDGGTTWDVVPVPATEPAEVELELGWAYIGLADDGALCATLYRFNQAAGYVPYKRHWDIWRGVGNWNMGAGPCLSSGPPPPVHTHNFAHVPERDTYQPCPQECST